MPVIQSPEEEARASVSNHPDTGEEGDNKRLEEGEDSVT